MPCLHGIRELALATSEPRTSLSSCGAACLGEEALEEGDLLPAGDLQQPPALAVALTDSLGRGLVEVGRGDVGQETAQTNSPGLHPASRAVSLGLGLQHQHSQDSQQSGQSGQLWAA